MSAVPAGYTMMHDPVGPACTAFAVEVLNDPTVPMGSVVERNIGGRDIAAHVEPHTWTFRGGVRVACNPPIRGVTLYERVGSPAPAPGPAPKTIPAPPSHFARGCDVSHYQRGGLQWADLKRRGCLFAYLKATEGGSLEDDTFLLNAEHTRAASVLRGAYHFFRPTVDVPTQVARFVATCLKAGPLELPPALDVEVSDGVSPGVLAAAVEHFVDLVTPQLGRPVIYTAPGWWPQHAGNAHLADKADLWVAHWTSAAHPLLCGNWTEWLFWQTAPKSDLAGDADVFNGGAEELLTRFSHLPP